MDIFLLIQPHAQLKTFYETIRITSGKPLCRLHKFARHPNFPNMQALRQLQMLPGIVRQATSVCAFWLLLTSLLCGQSQPNDSENLPVVTDSPQITYFDGFILGLVEGVTEYLPVSSTGHLILCNHILELDQAIPLLDKSGQPILTDEIDPKTQQPIPFTLEDAANGYAVIIQAGAIAAVMLIYWQRIMLIIMGVLGKSREGLFLARNIIVAFLPAAFLGLLLDDLIESFLFGPYPVIFALVVGGIVMLKVDKRQKQKSKYSDSLDSSNEIDLHQLSIRECLIVGFLQCVAMWPGTSRSMMTIIGGYLIGLSPKRAAEFSFLLGLVTLSAASGYKALSIGENMFKALDLGPIFFGMFVATLSAALAVKWMVGYLTKHGLALFAWYRIALAIVFAVMMVIL